MTKNTLISIETIQHDQQRYPTAGDWQWEEDGSLSINVSKMHVQEYMWLVAVHEIIEAILCKANGITDEIVTNWDKDHLYDCDPGGIQDCPYYKEHLVATIVETMLADRLKIDWKEYEKTLDAL
jgi:hypothetical protein